MRIARDHGDFMPQKAGKVNRGEKGEFRAAATFLRRCGREAGKNVRVRGFVEQFFTHLIHTFS